MTYLLGAILVGMASVDFKIPSFRLSQKNIDELPLELKVEITKKCLPGSVGPKSPLLVGSHENSFAKSMAFCLAKAQRQGYSNYQEKLCSQTNGNLSDIDFTIRESNRLDCDHIDNLKRKRIFLIPKERFEWGEKVDSFIAQNSFDQLKHNTHLFDGPNQHCHVLFAYIQERETSRLSKQTIKDIKKAAEETARNLKKSLESFRFGFRMFSADQIYSLQKTLDFNDEIYQKGITSLCIVDLHNYQDIYYPLETDDILTSFALCNAENRFVCAFKRRWNAVDIKHNKLVVYDYALNGSAYAKKQMKQKAEILLPFTSKIKKICIADSRHYYLLSKHGNIYKAWLENEQGIDSLKVKLQKPFCNIVQMAIDPVHPDQMVFIKNESSDNDAKKYSLWFADIKRKRFARSCFLQEGLPEKIKHLPSPGDSKIYMEKNPQLGDIKGLRYHNDGVSYDGYEQMWYYTNKSWAYTTVVIDPRKK